MTVLSIDKYRTNAELIAACAELGYLTKQTYTWDATYGEGTFWKLWRPYRLWRSDIVAAKSPMGLPIDFTQTNWRDRQFDAVVFDPPYKLNGTPDPEVDRRYGVDKPSTWHDRIELMRKGLREACRVSDDWVFVKCQDQVVSGKIRWQTDMMTSCAHWEGFGKYDRLDMLSYRPQPANRSQKHSHRNASTLLVFKRLYNPNR